jgi:trigger factor
MIVREIFSAEKLAITNDELNEELFAMAQEYQMEPMELLEAMRKSGSLQELQFRAISRKVTNFLIENANITEGEAPAPKPAKKASAKKADAAPAGEDAPKKKAPAKKKAE